MANEKAEVKKEKVKVTKDMVPEGFSVAMALVDAIPVLFFAINIIVLGMVANFQPLIMIGGLLCFVGGAIKVLWKVIVATKKKNVWWMFIQMRYTMLIGFVLIIIGCIVGHSALAAAFSGIGIASIIFLVLWVLGMVLMGVFAKVLDNGNPKANWIEQGTNGAAQIFLCIALLLLK